MTLDNTRIFIDIAICLLALICVVFFFSKRMLQSEFWRATVTPLASIIGSGFLVVAPLLWILVGYNAVWVLLGILIVAYGAGAVVRYNILYVEPYLLKAKKSLYFTVLNDFSYFTLGLAYFISVAFYVRILSAFALKGGFGLEEALYAKLLTTVILGAIGIIGYFRGFRWLESLELYSVNLKLCIIAMLVLGLFMYDGMVLNFHHFTVSQNGAFTFETFRKICGTLLIVQGFEISRYMGHNYHGLTRVKSMRLAQIIASVIYLSFIYLILFIMGEDQQVTETAIIDVTQNVSFLLPLAITFGAVFAQFSAAVADTIGCGGIVTEYSRNKISQNVAYALIAFASIFLIWVANVFEIISIASRAFAAYYLTQCMQGFYVHYFYNRLEKPWMNFLCVGVGIIMLVVLLLGLPAE